MIHIRKTAHSYCLVITKEEFEMNAFAGNHLLHFVIIASLSGLIGGYFFLSGMHKAKVEKTPLGWKVFTGLLILFVGAVSLVFVGVGTHNKAMVLVKDLWFLILVFVVLFGAGGALLRALGHKPDDDEQAFPLFALEGEYATALHFSKVAPPFLISKGPGIILHILSLIPLVMVLVIGITFHLMRY